MDASIPVITIVILIIISFSRLRYRKSIWFLILNFLILALFSYDISRTPENHYPDLFLIILTVFNVYRFFRDRSR